MKVALKPHMTKSVAAGVFLLAGVTAVGPLAVLEPCVSLSPAERRALESGGVVSRALPANDRQVALFAATRIAADADTFVTATRAIADLKKSSFVVAIQRFSDPPKLADLDGLVPADRDINALAVCAIDDCSFKFTRNEIAAVVRTRTVSGTSRAVLEAAVRQVLFDRVTRYLSEGLGSLPPIENRGHARRWDETLAAMRAESPCLTQFPPLAAWLSGDPPGGHDIESFVYWSYENYGAGKPVILITHVAIFRPSADSAIVVGKQLFASRYMDGGIAMTALIAERATDAHYLVYLNRTSVDLLGGLLGGLKRSMLESRLENEGSFIIDKLRARLERSASE